MFHLVSCCFLNRREDKEAVSFILNNNNDDKIENIGTSSPYVSQNDRIFSTCTEDIFFVTRNSDTIFVTFLIMWIIYLKQEKKL